jgi:subtilisin family serine protease
MRAARALRALLAVALLLLLPPLARASPQRAPRLPVPAWGLHTAPRGNTTRVADADAAGHDDDDDDDAVWIITLRDRSHAAAVCAEAEGRRGAALRRFAGACARPPPGVGGRLAPLGVLRFAPARHPSGRRAAHVAALRRALGAAGVAAAERDAPVALAAAGTAAGSGAQRTGRDLWHLDRLDQDALPLDGAFAPPLWPPAASALDGAGVHLYVLDTGVRGTHLELRGRVGPGVDLVGASDAPGGALDGGAPRDPHGHGTHVAAAAAGARSGVAKGATVHSVRILDEGGDASWARVLAGLDWVAEHAARPAVAVLSLAGGRSAAAERAVAALAASGVLVVAAAGNAGGDACAGSPAAGGAALVAGAASAADARAPFSNHGPCVDVFAPGVDVLSAWGDADGATRLASGTSAAAPLAAGAAALLLQAAPGAGAAAAKAALLAAATPAQLAAASLGASSPNRLLSVRRLASAAQTLRATAGGLLAPDALAGAGSGVTLVARPAPGCAAVPPLWSPCDVRCGWGRQRRSAAAGAGDAGAACASAAAGPDADSRACFAGPCDNARPA